LCRKRLESLRVFGRHEFDRRSVSDEMPCSFRNELKYLIYSGTMSEFPYLFKYKVMNIVRLVVFSLLILNSCRSRSEQLSLVFENGTDGMIDQIVLSIDRGEHGIQIFNIVSKGSKSWYPFRLESPRGISVSIFTEKSKIPRKFGCRCQRRT
jgi:hypothetical protein